MPERSEGKRILGAISDGVPDTTYLYFMKFEASLFQVFVMLLYCPIYVQVFIYQFSFLYLLVYGTPYF